MKSGAMIVDNTEISKYFAYFMIESNNPEISNSKDKISIYIDNVNDYCLANYRNYLNKFSNVLADSNVLEVFSFYDKKKDSIFSYVGKYNEKNKIIEVNRDIEEYFDEINDLITYKAKNDEGR